MTDHTTVFRHDQYTDTYPVGIERHWWTRARFEIVRKVVANLPRAKILDIGCGPGLVVAYLRNHGLDCWGCEVGSPNVREAARDFVWPNTDALELIPEFRRTVGIILLLDVLEHLPDPLLFLFKLLNAYPTLQAVVTTVPARAELWTAWDDQFGHYLRYDRGMLANLYRQAGIEITQLRYIFQGVYPALFLASRMKSRGTSIRAPKMLWLHTVLAKWFVVESSIPGIGRVPGTSLLVTGVPMRAESQP
jgi:hypothetical protein